MSILFVVNISIVFLFLNHMGNTVCGVYLKHGTDEKGHNPVVVNRMNICIVSFNRSSKKWEEEPVYILKHQQTGDDEGNIGKHHYMAESLQGDVISFIGLSHLHKGE